MLATLATATSLNLPMTDSKTSLEPKIDFFPFGLPALHGHELQQLLAKALHG